MPLLLYYPLNDLSEAAAFSVDLPDRRERLSEWIGAALSALSHPPSPRARPVFATEIRPRHVLREAGILYLDLPAEAAVHSGAGAALEQLAVESIVRSVGSADRETRAVKILVHGAERETLWGHVDLRRPFPVP